MLIGARLFVAGVFILLGISFLLATCVLVWEFADGPWFDLLSLDSHLFVFFPTLGILTLIALFIPASVFVDLYWHHVWYGKQRFLFGFFALAALSTLIAHLFLQNPSRSIWETEPRVLLADAGEPAGCATHASGNGDVCLRMPLLSALGNLRQISASHWGLEALVRDCSAAAADPLAPPAKRFCLASTPLSSPPTLQSDAECCIAQARFVDVVRANYADPAKRSFTSRANAVLLPLRIFFLLVVLVIGILLAIHHKNVEDHYPARMRQIETGLLISAVCLMFFPLMAQAFLNSSQALNGSAGRGLFSVAMPLVSLLYLAWSLLIGLFFRRRTGEELLSVGRVGGLLAGSMGIIKYNLLIAAFAWGLGSGATELGIAGLVGGCLVAMPLMIWGMRAAKTSESPMDNRAS